MNHATSMTPPPAQGQHDDWETADLTSFAPHPQSFTQPSSGTLRPSAPEFKPRPTAAVAPSSVIAPTHSNGTAPSPKLLARTDEGHLDDDWFATRRPSSNRQIWDSANAARPLVALASTSQTHTFTPIGPPIPTMQILRRPTDSNSGNKNRSEEARRAKTIGEREEEYRLARERIFGAGAGAQGGEGLGSGRASPSLVAVENASSSSLSVVPSQIRRSPLPGGGGGGRISSGSSSGVVRQPRGPGEGYGFGDDGGGRSGSAADPR